MTESFVASCGIKLNFYFLMIFLESQKISRRTNLPMESFFCYYDVFSKYFFLVPETIIQESIKM